MVQVGQVSSKKTVSRSKWNDIHQRRMVVRQSTHRERLINYKSGAAFKKQAKNPLTVKLPQKMNLGKERDEFLGAMHILRTSMVDENKDVFIDFSDCDDLSLDALLVFIAEIYRCLALSGKRLWGNYPRNKGVLIHLIKSGYYEFVKANLKPAAEDLLPHIEVIKLRTANRDKSYVKSDIAELISSGNSSQMDIFVHESAMAIGDAMENSLQHAYKSTTPDPYWLIDQWYMFASKNTLTGEIIICFYDQGQGIPKTVPAKLGEKFIASLSGGLKSQDAYLIELSFEVGRTETYDPHRGEGMASIRDLVEECEEGVLKILSNKGEYLYTKGGNVYKDNRDTVLPGTLIVWHVKNLKGAEGYEKKSNHRKR